MGECFALYFGQRAGRLLLSVRSHEARSSFITSRDKFEIPVFSVSISPFDFPIHHLVVRDHANELAHGFVRRDLSVSILNVLPVVDFLDVGLERAILEFGHSVVNKLVSKTSLVMLVSRAQAAAYACVSVGMVN